MAGTSPAMTKIFALLVLVATARQHIVAVGSVPLTIGGHLHPLPKGEDDESG
jgi:hypothetical protein